MPTRKSPPASPALYVVNRNHGSGVVTDADKIAVSAVPEVVGSRAFSLGDSNADQWTANSETIFVVATYELKNNGQGPEELR